MRKVPRAVGDRAKIYFLASLGILFWGLLLARLFKIQLLDRGRYVELARLQYIDEVKLEARRGLIYDRHLNRLTLNTDSYSLGLDVRAVTDPHSAAHKLATALGHREDLTRRALNGARPFVWLARGIDEKEAQRLATLDVPGLKLVKESRRLYPHREVAAQLIGFTDIDQRGLSGVELAFDHLLRGEPGWAQRQADATGRAFTEVSYPAQGPKEGKDIILTIDYIYQSIAQEELRRSVDLYEADGGTVVITEPQTGEILAIAVEPSFDPNRAREYSPNRWRNRAITDVFEPGSTFKIVTFAAALEEGIKRSSDIIYCENGTYKINGRIIRDVHKYGWLTVREVLKQSSNIGTAKIAQEVGSEKLYEFARRFGFGTPTSVELPGEVPGLLKHPIEWSGVTLPTLAIGYEVMVTPLQMAMAYGAIANGGVLLKPRILKGVMHSPEKIQWEEEVSPVRRVLSEPTARTLADILEEAVLEGTGVKARIEGVRIAGKTGTAQKFEGNSNGYHGQFYASFAGFFPADQPQWLVLVVMDNPKITYWGGEVAAPTFKRIVQRILHVSAKMAAGLDEHPLGATDRTALSDGLAQNAEIDGEVLDTL